MQRRETSIQTYDSPGCGLAPKGTCRGNHGEHQKQARERKTMRGAHPSRSGRSWTREGSQKRDRAPEELTHKPGPATAGDSHHGRPRLCREEQSRKPALGNDGDLARRAREHGRTERLLLWRVLAQERQDLRPEPSPSLHHEGGQN